MIVAMEVQKTGDRARVTDEKGRDPDHGSSIGDGRHGQAAERCRSMRGGVYVWCGTI